MKNAGLNEAQAGIKIAWRNIHNLRYADDTTFMAESEELKSLLRGWGCRPHSETGALFSLQRGAAGKGWRAPAGSQNYPQPWIDLTEFRSGSSPLILRFLFSSGYSSRRSRSFLHLCRRSQLLFQSEQVKLCCSNKEHPSLGGLQQLRSDSGSCCVSSVGQWGEVCPFQVPRD